MVIAIIIMVLAIGFLAISARRIAQLYRQGRSKTKIVQDRVALNSVQIGTTLFITSIVIAVLDILSRY